MRRDGSFEAQNRAFVARSIRTWEADHARRRRRPTGHRPYRRKRGLLSGIQRNFGFIALAILAAFAGLQNLAPTGMSVPGLSAFASSGGRVDRTVSRSFPICSGPVRINCVVDGDTLWLDGQKIRLADINAPEVSSPKCSAEAALGARATRRLQSLLAAGGFEVEVGARDEDVYGRKLRTLSRNGRSLGAVMVAEGLAHEWHGHKEDWCA